MHANCIPHYGESKIERLPCMIATVEAIQRSNKYALSSAHPARVEAEALIRHLTDQERRRLEVRGHVLEAVIGRGLSVCGGGAHVRPAGERCESGR